MQRVLFNEDRTNFPIIRVTVSAEEDDVNLVINRLMNCITQRKYFYGACKSVISVY